jgi:hypothetical protein
MLQNLTLVTELPLAEPKAENPRPSEPQLVEKPVSPNNHATLKS